MPLMMISRGDGEGAEPAVGPEEDGEEEDWDVVYKAPCGQSLRNHDDVMRFLLATESYDVLQVCCEAFKDQYDSLKILQ